MKLMIHKQLYLITYKHEINAAQLKGVEYEYFLANYYDASEKRSQETNLHAAIHMPSVPLKFSAYIIQNMTHR